MRDANAYSVVIHSVWFYSTSMAAQTRAAATNASLESCDVTAESMGGVGTKDKFQQQ